MCGIAGQVVVGGSRADLGAVRRMCAAEVHRGPDSDGFHSGEGVALGVRRLAIIDVKGGDQPITSEDGSVVVVMNGEIYNFQTLRQELEDRGHRFLTRSDTEVLVHLYEDYGEALVHRLRGMFAFAIWDARRRRLLLARDRVGKKPLHYFDRGGRLSFASELAALLEDARIPRLVDPQAIDAYLALLYVPHPLCAVEGVRKLPPASILTWENGKMRVERYWRLDYSQKENGSSDEQSQRIREHLREAVRIRLVSERPLGAFLSGGVDSAGVVAMMADLASGPVKTFSIGFTSDRFDELPHARRIAELYSTDHVEHIVEPDAVAILPKLVTHYGDPFADSSAVPSFYVASVASREVTVTLNGDGGDENFAGYNRYISGAIVERLAKLPAVVRRTAAWSTKALPRPTALDSATARAVRLLRSLGQPADRRYALRMLYTTRSLREALYEPAFASSVETGYAEDLLAQSWRTSTAASPIDRMLDVDVDTYLPGDLLTKMDIATMASSLEARSPYLDHVFMEMAARLPVTAKLRGATTKAGLKAALVGLVPDDLLRRPKQGFSVPLSEWVRGPLHSVTRQVLLDPAFRGRGQFQPAVIKRMLSEQAEGRADHASELWALLMLELWQRRFIDGLSEGALL
jgi:asparagine synthase (glutamine-hydrolysing)